MTDKPHICFVAPFAWSVLCDSAGLASIGGAEVQQVLIAAELVRRGYSVTIITLDYGQAGDCRIAGMNILTTCRPGQGIPVLRFLHPNISSLWKALKKANADIYYQRSAAYLTGIVSLFARRHKKKFIYAAASNLDFMKGRELLTHGRDIAIYRYGLKRADAVIVQNKNQEKNCQDRYHIVPNLIPNLYPTPSKTKASTENTHILWVGAIRKIKQPELFLGLAKKLIEFQFVMVGSMHRACPEYYAEIKARAEYIQNLDFLGFQPLTVTERMFDKTAVFVNTSEAEGFPNTFLQAWARGVPTLSFFSPFSDSGEGGRPGCYVATMDELRQKLLELMTTPVYRQETGEACRAYYLNHFSPTVVMPEYEKVISRLGF